MRQWSGSWYAGPAENVVKLGYGAGHEIMRHCMSLGAAAERAKQPRERVVPRHAHVLKQSTGEVCQISWFLKVLSSTTEYYLGELWEIFDLL